MTIIVWMLLKRSEVKNVETIFYFFHLSFLNGIYTVLNENVYRHQIIFCEYISFYILHYTWKTAAIFVVIYVFSDDGGTFRATHHHHWEHI